MIGLQRAALGEVRAFIPQDRVIRAQPMDVAPEQRAGAAVFRHQLVAVIEELRGARRAARSLEQPAHRVIAERRRRRPGGRDQTVLLIIDHRRRAIGGEVAVGVVSERRRPGAGILVQPIDRVGPVDIVGRVRGD